MSTEICKEVLDEYLEYQTTGNEKGIGKWKRTKKFKDSKGRDVRTFENKVLPITKNVVESVDGEFYIETVASDWYFEVRDDDDMFEQPYAIIINKEFWHAKGHMYTGDITPAIADYLPAGIENMEEGTYGIDYTGLTWTASQLRQKLLDAGFVEKIFDFDAGPTPMEDSSEVEDDLKELDIIGKFGFLRRDAIRHLTELDDDADMDDEEEADRNDYSTMTNKELEAEMCSSGLVHDDSMCGVFDELPPGVIDGTRHAENESGWPPTMDEGDYAQHAHEWYFDVCSGDNPEIEFLELTEADTVISFCRKDLFDAQGCLDDGWDPSLARFIPADFEGCMEYIYTSKRSPDNVATMLAMLGMEQKNIGFENG